MEVRNKLLNLIKKFNKEEDEKIPFASGVKIINLRNLEHNIKEIKKFTGKNHLFPIKAQAYGANLVNIAKFIELSQLSEYLGVASLQEAFWLRQANIVMPILIFSNVSSNLEHLEYIVKNDIEVTVSDKTLLENLAKVATKNNKKAKIHLKIDTGMGRIGVLPEQVDFLLDEILIYVKSIQLIGCMTHFSVADSFEVDDIEYTNQQAEKFKLIRDKVKQKFNHNIIFHCANSSSVANGFNFVKDFDMVRTGILSHGYKNLNYNIKPVMKVKTGISLLKQYPKNYCIGYGRTYKTQKEGEIIAVISLGYADGLIRALSNKLKVKINNKLYDAVGRICMDQFMVRVDETVKLNDEVYIICQENNAQQIAKSIDTIAYEMLCGVGTSNRLKYKYVY